MFTSTAIQIALGNEEFRKELASYIIPRFSSSKVGIVAADLCLNQVQQLFAPYAIRYGFTKKRDASAELRRWRSASALIFIVADGDTLPYWVDAGRCYARTVLEITRRGFAHATSAAVAEAFDFHKDIEQMLNTTSRIMSVIRVGKSSFHPSAHRRLDATQIIR